LELDAEGGADFRLVMANHRHTVTIPIRVSDHPILARVSNEPSLKVMVFCAGDLHGRQDIAFPHQSEIKVNGGEVKANLRGLKNKPGSTRPVDITNELRLKINSYSNNVEMTYALTSKVDCGSLQVSCPHPGTLFAYISPPLPPFCIAVWSQLC
jgi:E3 SUMO-protein ligase PIAS1